MAIISSLFFLLVYFAPSIVAACREHHKMETLILLNLCLGWTGIGWFALLVWSWFGQGKAKLN
jgi:hypothetical protein